MSKRSVLLELNKLAFQLSDLELEGFILLDEEGNLFFVLLDQSQLTFEILILSGFLNSVFIGFIELNNEFFNSLSKFSNGSFILLNLEFELLERSKGLFKLNNSLTELFIILSNDLELFTQTSIFEDKLLVAVSSFGELGSEFSKFLVRSVISLGFLNSFFVGLAKSFFESSTELSVFIFKILNSLFSLLELEDDHFHFTDTRLKFFVFSVSLRKSFL